MMVKAILVATIGATMPNIASAQLTGSVRTNFVTSYLKNCFETQRAGSPNAKVLDSTLKQYCNCLATNVADSTNNQIVSEIEQGNVKMSALASASAIAEKYCTKNYAKY